MKRISAAVGLAVVASIAANATNASTVVRTTPTAAKKTGTADPCASRASKFQRDQCEKYTHSAPGDEYFGRLKLSYLGINNTFHDSAIRSGAYTLDSGIIAKVNFADDALRAWASKYPNDPQLARSYYLAIEAFMRIYTPQAQNKAWQYMNVLVHKFPSTYFGKLEKKNLQIGFTEHYFAIALSCPTPLPTSSPVNGRHSSTPEPLSTDTPVPEPTDTPTPQPGQPKIQLITPPCVPAPSPTPLLTETPLPTETPTPLGTPAPMGTPMPAETPTPAVMPTPSALPSAPFPTSSP